MEPLFEKVDPINIYKESLNFQVVIGNKIHQELRVLSENILVNINQQWPMGRGERKLIGTIWSYLALAGDEGIKKDCVEAIVGSSMTMARSALQALKPLDSPETEEASNLFYDLWKGNSVVLD